MDTAQEIDHLTSIKSYLEAGKTGVKLFHKEFLCTDVMEEVEASLNDAIFEIEQMINSRITKYEVIGIATSHNIIYEEGHVMRGFEVCDIEEEAEEALAERKSTQARLGEGKEMVLFYIKEVNNA